MQFLKGGTLLFSVITLVLTLGCGLYGSWQAPMYHRNISSLWLNDIASTVIQDSTVQAENKCYRVRERVCDDASRGCTGPSREIKVVECPKVYVNSTGGKRAFSILFSYLTLVFIMTSVRRVTKRCSQC